MNVRIIGAFALAALILTTVLRLSTQTFAQPAAGERWAVIIGVGHHDKPGIPARRYSVADAEAFYAALTTTAGFQKDHVVLLTDRTSREPNLRNIKWALGTFLARSARQDDMVVVYFSGGSAAEPDGRGAEHDKPAKYLLPTDADLRDLISTAVPIADLPTILDRIESERVIVFLEANYSGVASRRMSASELSRARGVDGPALERIMKSKDRIVVASSRPSELALELPELHHGVFTYYLLEGFKGSADHDRDGVVTLQELYGFVQREVVSKSRSIGGSQHPVLSGELSGALPLTQVPRP